MSGPAARRGFLRGLISLPLVGGGVTLIGDPTAAAVPVTDELLDAYDEWLDLERSFLKWERYGPDGMHHPDRTMVEAVFRNWHTGQLFDWRPVNRVRGRSHGREGDSPASRAAVVLSASGCGWRRT